MNLSGAKILGTKPLAEASPDELLKELQRVAGQGTQWELAAVVARSNLDAIFIVIRGILSSRGVSVIRLDNGPPKE